jgi:hypothetical protein
MPPPQTSYCWVAVQLGRFGRVHLYQQSRHLVYDRATSNLTLNHVLHLGRHDRATPEVSQTLRSKWRDCVEGSVAIVLWEGRDCVVGSGTPVPPATAITTPITVCNKEGYLCFHYFLHLSNPTVFNCWSLEVVGSVFERHRHSIKCGDTTNS